MYRHVIIEDKKSQVYYVKIRKSLNQLSKFYIDIACNKRIIKESNAHSSILQENVSSRYSTSLEYFRFNYISHFCLVPIYVKNCVTAYCISLSDSISHPRLNFANSFFQLPQSNYSTI